jgi:hypothetical protein
MDGVYSEIDRVRRMKIALLFLLIGAIVWWSHIGASSQELTDKAVGPA